MPNPIKYSDLVQADASISTLVAQLKDAKSSYEALANSIKTEAQAVANGLKSLSGATSDGQKGIEKMSGATENYYNTMKSIEGAINELTATIKGWNGAVTTGTSNVSQAATKVSYLAGSYKALKSEVDQLTKEWKEMGSAQRESAGSETTDRIKELRAQLQGLEAELKPVTQVITSQSTSIKALGQEIKNLIEQYLRMSEAERQSENGQNVLASIREKSNVYSQLNKQMKSYAVSVNEALNLARKQVSSVNEANRVNKILRDTVKSLTDAEDKHGTIRRKLNDAIEKNTRYIQSNSDAMTRNKMNVGNYTQSIKSAFSELTRGSGAIQGITNAFSTGSSTGNVWLGVIVAAAAALREFYEQAKEAAKVIVDFEFQGSKLKAILGESSEGLKELTASARALGAVTPYTASQVSSLQYELARLGFNKDQILQSTSAILDFAKVVDTDLASAAQLAGSVIRGYGASTLETTKYVSAMSVATARSAMSFSDLESSFTKLIPVAKSYGFTIEDTLALYGTLKNAGFDASSAATALRNIMLNLADANGKLAKQLGHSVSNLDELAAALQEVKSKGISLTEELLATDKRSVAAYASLINMSDSLVSLRDSISDATGEFYTMSETMEDNVHGSILKLQSAWESLQLTFSSSTGWMKNVIDWVTSLVGGFEMLISNVDQINERMTGQSVARAQKEMQVDGTFADQEKAMRKQYQREYDKLLKEYQDSYQKDETVRASFGKQVKEKGFKNYVELIESKAKEEAQQIVKDNFTNLLNAEIAKVQKKNEELKESQGTFETVRSGKFLYGTNAFGKIAAYLTGQKQIIKYADQIAQNNAQISRNQALLQNAMEVNLTGEGPEKQVTGKPQRTRTPIDPTNQIENARLQANKKLRSAETSSEEDEFKKREQLAEDSYNNQIESLEEANRKQEEILRNAKGKYITLTAEQEKTITDTIEKNNKTIVALEDSKQLELKKIRSDRAAAALTLQKSLNDQELSIAEQGTDEWFRLKKLSIEYQRDIDLLKIESDTSLTSSQKADKKKAVNDKAERDTNIAQGTNILKASDNERANQMAVYQQRYRTETEITRMTLEQERDRLNQQIELTRQGMTTWTAQQVQAAEDAVNGINRQLEKIASTGSVLSDIGEYGLSGGILAQMGFSKEEIDAVGQAIDSTISSLNDLAQAYVDVAQAAVDAAQEQVDAAQKVLDNEIEARNNGYANSVETAKKELAAAEKTEQQKEKQLRKAQRAQEALDSAEQTSSLITATALLWKSYSGMGPASVALAIAATAAMWGSFTIAKIKAVQATKASSSTYGEGGMEILEGGSHISGNDIDLHQKNRKGKNMRAEGGEAMIIINKQRTKKYAKVLPEIVTSLNKGVFEEKFTKLFGNTEQLAPIVNIGSTSVDMTRVEHELSAIRKQGEDRYNVLPDGTFIICSGNVKRIVKRL